MHFLHFWPLIIKILGPKTPIEKLWNKYGKYGFSWVAWGEGPAGDKDKWMDRNIYQIPLIETVKYLLIENERQLPAKVTYSNLRVPPNFFATFPRDCESNIQMGLRLHLMMAQFFGLTVRWR